MLSWSTSTRTKKLTKFKCSWKENTCIYFWSTPQKFKGLLISTVTLTDQIPWHLKVLSFLHIHLNHCWSSHIIVYCHFVALAYSARRKLRMKIFFSDVLLNNFNRTKTKKSHALFNPNLIYMNENDYITVVKSHLPIHGQKKTYPWGSQTVLIPILLGRVSV